MFTQKTLKRYRFTVDDHVNDNSPFLINRVRLSGDYITVSYMLTPEADNFHDVTLLTITIFDEVGTTKKVLDFEVEYNRIESFELDWEDKSFIDVEVRFSVLGRKAH